MKRKYIFTAAAVISALLLGSCSGGQNSAVFDAVIEDATQSKAVVSGTAKPDEEISTQQTTTAPPAAQVDLDLTQMSSTMVYAAVYNIMNDPESSRGQSIMVDGYFAVGGNEELGTTYYFVVIPDATACCSQGLEFICDGLRYPEDYPEEGTDIRIRGVIDRYYEEGNPYYYVKADEMKIL